MTDEECAAVINKLVDFWFAKVLERMARGQSFEDALEETRQEILNV